MRTNTTDIFNALDKYAETADYVLAGANLATSGAVVAAPSAPTLALNTLIGWGGGQ